MLGRTLKSNRCGEMPNEMVSLGDTAISLHILQPVYGVGTKSYSLKLGVGDGGGGNVKYISDLNSEEKVRVRISGGGGGDVKCQNPKCQDLSKFQFFGGVM